MSPLAKTRADALVDVITKARPTGPSTSEKSTWRASSTRAQRWSELLLAIVHVVGEDTGIASRLLATRADAEEVARIVDEKGMEAAASLPAFSTWRREVIGDVWRGWLEGRVTLVGDPVAPHGIRLVPR